MGLRRQAREAAVQALFMCDFHQHWDYDTMNFCLDYFDVSPSTKPFAEQLCKAVLDNLVKIDSKITCASEQWSISRMGRVDRAILRLAVCEMYFMSGIPLNVAINEAIEIAKRFGSVDSPMFINGVLDKTAEALRSKVEVISTTGQIKETEIPLDRDRLSANIIRTDQDS